MIDAPGLDERQLRVINQARRRYHGDLLSCCAAKFILDGVLESHTAYLPAGYADDPGQTGLKDVLLHVTSLRQTGRETAAEGADQG